jgi:hypothetical protein
LWPASPSSTETPCGAFDSTTYDTKMLLDVNPQTSVFVAGFEPTLHSFYTVFDFTCSRTSGCSSVRFEFECPSPSRNVLARGNSGAMRIRPRPTRRNSGRKPTLRRRITSAASRPRSSHTSEAVRRRWAGPPGSRSSIKVARARRERDRAASAAGSLAVAALTDLTLRRVLPPLRDTNP